MCIIFCRPKWRGAGTGYTDRPCCRVAQTRHRFVQWPKTRQQIQTDSVKNDIKFVCSVFFLLQSRRFLRMLMVHKSTAHSAPYYFAYVFVHKGFYIKLKKMFCFSLLPLCSVQRPLHQLCGHGVADGASGCGQSHQPDASQQPAAHRHYCSLQGVAARHHTHWQPTEVSFSHEQKNASQKNNNNTQNKTCKS